jgi:hypothetical protein
MTKLDPKRIALTRRTLADRVEALQRVATIAGCIVLEANDRWQPDNPRRPFAVVRRKLVERLDEALTAAGCDMETSRQLLRESEAQ